MIMKKLSLLFICLSLYFCGFAQNITGQWKGAADIFGSQLPIVLHISSSDLGYSATLDSPDQQAFDIPIDSISFEDKKLDLKISAIGMTYSGVLNEDHSKFSGDFEQNNYKFPLDLIRVESAEKETTDNSPTRPQEPKKPYPYKSEDLNFENTEQNIRLAGTLTLPETLGKYPAVILITGSGPQNRNEEIFNHKPFLIIADYLTRNGVAVLRYDDRGTAESGGKFEGATTADFATDARAAFDFLKTRKEIDSTKIGLLGHSEGAVIAVMLAAQYQDIGFIGLLAGPGVDGGDVLLKQQEMIGKASGLSEKYIQLNKKINAEAYSFIREEKDSIALRHKLKTQFEKALKTYPDWNTGKAQGMSDDQFVKILLDTYTDSWMHYFISYNPAKDLAKVTCPVLALNGDKDLQVDAKQNLTAIKSTLGETGNQYNLIEELEGLNHLFQESETGSPSEYGLIEQTISPEALEIMKNWILSLYSN